MYTPGVRSGVALSNTSRARTALSVLSTKPAAPSSDPPVRPMKPLRIVPMRQLVLNRDPNSPPGPERVPGKAVVPEVVQEGGSPSSSSSGAAFGTPPANQRATRAAEVVQPEVLSSGDGSNYRRGPKVVVLGDSTFVLPRGTGLMPAGSAAARPRSRTASGTVRTQEEVAAGLAARPSEMDFKWSQDSYNTTWRTIDTWSFFITFRVRSALREAKWSYLGGFTEEKKTARTRSLARYLLESVLQLGPTFIKVGQLSSTRADLFPAAFIEELTELQDRVPAFPAEKAIRIIEADLGQPIAQLFKTFDSDPIAAASLGQVHRAELWTGESVVVKVQRPGLKQLFDIDLQNLKLLAAQLDRTNDSTDLTAIYDECASVLYQEIDYINEGKNADRFRRNFAAIPWVKVPTVFWQFCSPRVLTLSYLPGIKITDKAQLESAGVAVDVVARRSTEAYLTQILQHAFFHADPHPGNLAVGADGSLIFYDFGMMGSIVPDVKERLTDVFYGIFKKDATLVIKALTDLKIIKSNGGDTLSIRRSINFALENLARQTEREETISAIGEDLFLISTDQPFRFPATFTFVLRAFSVLEGIGKTLDPEYRFSTIAQPYANDLLSRKEGQSTQGALLAQVQKQAVELGGAALSVPQRVQRIDSTLAQLEAGDLKLRVRVLETERADKRTREVQLATLYAVGVAGTANLGTTLALAHADVAAGVLFASSSIFALLIFLGFKRIARLDKFEKDLRA